MENWYFFAWYEGYKAQYDEWLASRRPSMSAFANRRASSPLAVTGTIRDRYIADGVARQHGSSISGTVQRPPLVSPGLHPTSDSGMRRQSMSFELLMRKEPSISPSDLPHHLRRSFAMALEAFFDPWSRYQLNLDSDVTVRVRLDAEHSPDPSSTLR